MVLNLLPTSVPEHQPFNTSTVRSVQSKTAMTASRQFEASEFAPMTRITGRIDPHQQLNAADQRGCSHQRNTTMDRKTNINCLTSLLDAFERTNDDAARLRIRQAMYIHGIVDAVLTERVGLLPEASFASR